MGSDVPQGAAYANENPLLQPIGQSRMIGDEKPLFDEGVYKAGLSGFTSNNRKSIRYLHHDDEGNPIGALQIMTDGPRSKKAVIQNVYVAEPFRRNKIASGLLKRARQDYDVRHSDDLTDAGRAFKKAVKAGGGEVDDGITAYHGSPHDFEKFDLSKIGTGEGAQAYGHGLYFAESEPVAKGYRDTGFKQHGSIPIAEYKGQTIKPLRGELDKIDPHQFLLHAHQGYGDASKAIDVLNRFYPNAPEEYKKNVENLIKNTNSKDFKQHKGRMYEVSINAHPDHFLDWDKPIERQHPVVQKAIMSLPYANEKLLAGAPNLMFALEDMRSDWMQKNNMDTRGRMDHRRHVSEDLAKAGLPGIKYLDANSRTPPPNLDPDHIQRQIERNRTQAAQVTDAAHRADLDDDHNILLERLKKAESHLARNYVVFDHDLVGVKRKYARGGGVSM